MNKSRFKNQDVKVAQNVTPRAKYFSEKCKKSTFYRFISMDKSAKSENGGDGSGFNYKASLVLLPQTLYILGTTGRAFHWHAAAFRE